MNEAASEKRKGHAMKTIRLTEAQAIVRFLIHQHVVRDGKRAPFFAGCFGIFGHGNVAGLGQALQQQTELRYYQSRNEQAMVHAAAGYARMKNRLGALIDNEQMQAEGKVKELQGEARKKANRP